MNEILMDQQDVGLALTPEQQMICDRLPTVVTWADAGRFIRIDIRGECDAVRLQAALDQLLAAQPMLGARLAKAPGFHGLRQFAGKVGERFPLTVHSAVVDENEVQAQVLEWSQRAFAIDASTNAQAVLFALPEQQWALVLGVARHCLDDHALTLLYQQLLQAYEQRTEADSEATGEFAQYLEWRSEVILDEDAATARAYWQARLNGVDAALSSPWLAGRETLANTVSTAALETLNVPFDAALMANVQRLAQALDQPVTVLMQSAWWLLMARLSGRDDVLMGWRHDSREDYDYFAGALGVFEKTLPLDLSVDSGQSFAQWLPQVAARLEEHRVWQEYWAPELHPAAAQPAYGFAVQRVAQAQAPGSSPWSAQRLDGGAGSGFELLLQPQVTPQGDVTGLSLGYAAQRYSARAMHVLLDQFVTLLEGLTADAHAPMGEISLSSETERLRLLAFNPASRALTDARLLPERIAAWAQSHPEALALTENGATLTYGQLHAQVERLAGALHAEGIGRGAVVALALPRSAALVVAMLAAWRVGAAYLPLDRQWPQARQQMMIAQAGAALTLISEEAERGDSDVPTRTVEQWLATDNGAAPARSIAPDDLAYVLFTSGSTGTPKGVLIEHRHLLNYTAAVSSALALHEHRHFGFTSTVAADLGNTALFGALYNGAALHVASDEQMQDARQFADYLRREAVDCLKIVPSHLAALLDSDNPWLPRTLVLGGEAIAAQLMQRIAQVRGDCQVFNHYGPTETTVGVLVHRVAPDSPSDGAALSQVLANNRVYVLDACHKVVPVGVLGELYVGGAQLLRGYVNAEAEAGALIDNPFVAGERLYRTGDLARYRPEGGIVLHGRRDHQVKVRGFRIELSEVEEHLLRLPSVSEAVVLAADDAQQGLQAFVVVRETLSADSLREALAQQLPAVMVPQQIRLLERLPRLANGKVDRSALQQLSARVVEDDYVAPRDALEQLLAGRMAQLLGQDRFGIGCDFFAAGGHSLLVIKLVAGIRKLLQCDIHPGVVFDHPTVAGLAQALRSQEANPGQLDKLAQARLRLETMSDEEKAVLTEKARQMQAAKTALKG